MPGHDDLTGGLANMFNEDDFPDDDLGQASEPSIASIPAAPSTTSVDAYQVTTDEPGAETPPAPSAPSGWPMSASLDDRMMASHSSGVEPTSASGPDPTERSDGPMVTKEEERAFAALITSAVERGVAPVVERLNALIAVLTPVLVAQGLPVPLGQVDRYLVDKVKASVVANFQSGGLATTLRGSDNWDGFLKHELLGQSGHLLSDEEETRLLGVLKPEIEAALPANPAAPPVTTPPGVAAPPPATPASPAGTLPDGVDLAIVQAAQKELPVATLEGVRGRARNGPLANVARRLNEAFPNRQQDITRAMAYLYEKGQS